MTFDERRRLAHEAFQSDSASVRQMALLLDQTLDELDAARKDSTVGDLTFRHRGRLIRILPGTKDEVTGTIFDLQGDETEIWVMLTSPDGDSLDVLCYIDTPLELIS